MTRGELEFVRRLYAAGTSLDREELLAAVPAYVEAICDPEIEWVEDPRRADGRVYRGHAGVVRSFRRWLEQFSDYALEVQRVVDCGDAALVVVRELGWGGAAGTPVSTVVFQLVSIRDRKLVRFREFVDEATALRAAGLAEMPSESADEAPVAGVSA